MAEAFNNPPITPLTPPDDLPAWQQIDRLFQRHGLEPPPYRLRDELVTLFCWAHHGASRANVVGLGAANKLTWTSSTEEVAAAIRQAIRDEPVSSSPAEQGGE